MSFVIYNAETTRFARILRNGYWQDAEYKSRGAATAALNRIAAKNPEVKWAIADAVEFHNTIEKWETKRNLLSGLEFRQRVNTPLCCDPSSETYHSM